MRRSRQGNNSLAGAKSDTTPILSLSRVRSRADVIHVQHVQPTVRWHSTAFSESQCSSDVHRCAHSFDPPLIFDAERAQTIVLHVVCGEWTWPALVAVVDAREQERGEPCGVKLMRRRRCGIMARLPAPTGAHWYTRTRDESWKRGDS